MRVADDGGGEGDVVNARGEARGGGVLARAGPGAMSGRRSRNQERRRAVGVWSGEEGVENAGRGARRVMSSIGIGYGGVCTSANVGDFRTQGKSRKAKRKNTHVAKE